ncbi:argininosuccinate lyase [Candidatus Gottesmanbacteria bacterium RIFCSPHIGHO2_02_FULL_40_13]|uniref:Argininosuccinate lyase n=1 Tax=Candidatus Gottesmanbacteria bacterium RIFCSPHIGHO2_02_FULL_40_13 TaxID=1798384 RepID=A0A1F6A6W8_9BACT|nr:MAG: argininosuccinate lyase [Candidatus Gottesmanbacteria bacterium RIFCSPHIGHO2_02_FULL_40_13]
MNTNSFIVTNKQMELDLKLAPFDLWATKVHVLMLAKQKIIDEKIAKKILDSLEGIDREWKQGKFKIDPDKGLHLTIEAKVIEKIGTDGFFMHTARSRNDQVMTAEMIYLREKVLDISHKLLKLLKTLKSLTEKNIQTVMPGYTHMQPAKPTTFGQWNMSYFDMFTKCFDSLKFAFEKYNLCPLGAVESYGTSWQIDRAYTADMLGFAGVWEIPAEAISSRGFPQLAYLDSLKDIAIVISKIAADLLLFTTFEYGYITLADTTAVQMGSVTGSSIMPQKKNPDVLELLRSTAPQIIGYDSIVANLLSGLPMGYNRDTREVKEYIESGFSKVGDALESLTEVLKTMEVNKEKMYQAVLQNYSLSTDLADYISQQKGFPYRKVYKLVGELVKIKIAQKKALTDLTAKELAEFDLTGDELKSVLSPINAVMKRKHIGGASKQVMKNIIRERKKKLNSYAGWIASAWAKIQSSKEKTRKEIYGLS